jgi:hypothetical protein
LTLTGTGFEKGSVVVINGLREKTSPDKKSPATTLISKAVGRKISSGQSARLQVLNPNGRLSLAFNLTRS